MSAKINFDMTLHNLMARKYEDFKGLLWIKGQLTYHFFVYRID